jgi:hypothetical protein
LLLLFLFSFGLFCSWQRNEKANRRCIHAVPVITAAAALKMAAEAGKEMLKTTAAAKF